MNIADHYCSADFPFGKEKTHDHIQARIAWEWEAERIVMNSDMVGKEAVAAGHRKTRKAYEQQLQNFKKTVIESL